MDSVGEGEGGEIWENGIETCIISCMKRKKKTKKKSTSSIQSSFRHKNVLFKKKKKPQMEWFSSVQFSHSVVSNSLRPHESQHARPPCPSPTPRVYPFMSIESSSHPAISSSVVPFSSCPQSLPASESLPMSQLFTWGGQSVGISASASVLPMVTSL